MKKRVFITLLTALLGAAVTACGPVGTDAGKVENEAGKAENEVQDSTEITEIKPTEGVTEIVEEATTIAATAAIAPATTAVTENQPVTEVTVETTTEAAVKTPEQVYTDFLNGSGKVQTSEQFKADDSEYNADGLIYGSYSFSELKAAVAEFQMTEMNSEYALVDFGNDGIKELVLRFESANPNFMNWTGIIHSNNGNLELNSSYVDGYRTAAELYDNGYLLISGSSGAGVHNSMLKSFNANGTMYDVFSFNEYYGAFAEEIEFTLTQNVNWEDNHHIPYESLIEVKEYIEGEKVKVAVVGGWSEDAAIKAEEEDFIGYLESLGAELISAEEMNGLISIDSYKGNEVQWISHNS